MAGVGAASRFVGFANSESRQRELRAAARAEHVKRMHATHDEEEEDHKSERSGSTPSLAASRSVEFDGDQHETGLAPWRGWVHDNIVRRWWFDRVVLLVILCNCVTLALNNPTLDPESDMVKLLDVFEFIFAGIFTLEMLFKFAAMGFFRDAPAESLYPGYFRDSWNVMDFLIVVMGYLTLIPGVSNVSAIRIMRVLRPLRTVNNLRGLRVMVQTLMQSMAGLLEVVYILMFLFTIYGIIGIQLWEGQLKQRCFDITDTARTGPPGEYCGTTSLGYQCPAGQECVLDGGPNPNFGLIAFDNFAVALLTIFQAITMSDWVFYMYWYQRTSSGYAWIYWCTLILLVSFFSINLILAVVGAEFKESSRKDKILNPTTGSMNELGEPTCELAVDDVEDLAQYAREHGGDGDSDGEDADASHERPRHGTDGGTEVQMTAMTSVAMDGKPKAANGFSTTQGGQSQDKDRRPSAWMDKPSFDDGGDTDAIKSPTDTAAMNGTVAVRTTTPTGAAATGDTADNHAGEARYIRLKPKLTTTVKEGKRVRIVVLQMNRRAELQAEIDALIDDVKRTHVSSLELPDVEPMDMEELITPLYSQVRQLWFRKSEYLKDKPQIVHHIFNLIEHPYFGAFIVVAIIANTVLLATQYDGMSSSTEAALDDGNMTCTIIFIVEMVLKLIGWGPRIYVADPWNNFDATIVLISIIEFGALPGNGLSVLRTFRLLRILKLAKSLKSLRRLLGTVIASIVHVLYMTLLLMLFLFMFSVLGMQLFSGRFDSLPDDVRPRATFDSIYWAFLTNFQILTGDDWNAMMAVSAEATSGAAIVFFLVLVCLGTFVVINLFIAILLENFEDQDENKFLVEDLEDQALELAKKGDHQESIYRLSLLLAQKKLDAYKAHVEKENQHHAKKRKRAMQGKSFGYFDENSKLRQWCWDLKEHAGFQWFIILAILLNCVFLAMENPDIEDGSTMDELLRVSDIVFMVIFLLEMLIKWVAMGVYKDPPDVGEAVLLHSSGTVEKIQINRSRSASLAVDDDAAAAAAAAAEHKSDDDDGTLAVPPRLGRPMSSPAAPTLGRPGSAGSTGSAPGPDAVSKRRASLSIIEKGLQRRRASLKGASLGSQESVRSGKSKTGGFTLKRKKKVPKIFNIENETYFSDSWNWLDGFVVLVSILTLILPSIAALRSLRALRPLRVVVRSDQIRVVVSSLWRAVPAITNVFFFCALFWLIFGILGVNLFGGAMYSCTDESVTTEVACTGTFLDSNNATQTREWVNARINFDSTPEAMLTLFQIATLSGWADIMYATIDGTASGPQKNAYPAAGLYYVAFVIVCAFFSLNLFIGVVIDNFTQLKKEFEGSAFLTEEQRQWVATQKLIQTVTLHSHADRPTNPIRLWCYNFVSPKEDEEKVEKLRRHQAKMASHDGALASAQQITSGTSLAGTTGTIMSPNTTGNLGTSAPVLDPIHMDDNVDADAAAMKNRDASGGMVTAGPVHSARRASETSHGTAPITPSQGVELQSASSSTRGKADSAATLPGTLRKDNSIELAANRQTPPPHKEPQRQVLAPVAFPQHSLSTDSQNPPSGRTPGLRMGDMGESMPAVESDDEDDDDAEPTSNFDLFIMGMILLNTLTMATQHYQQSDDFTLFLTIANLFFVIIFSVEMILKVIAFTWEIYWSEPWNKFDCIIVVASWFGLIFDTGVGANVVRVFRIGRVFRIVRRAKSLRNKFETLILSVPSLWNIGLFLFVIFFMFAVLGVSFFGRVAFTDGGLSEDANFRDFGSAMLVLFRMATGDAWEDIMYGCKIKEPLCSEQEGTCGSDLAPLYFVAFMVLGSLVMLNLFIAVILENFEKEEGETEGGVEKGVAKRVKMWSKTWERFDPRASKELPARLFTYMMTKAPAPFGFGRKLQSHELLNRLCRMPVPIHFVRGGRSLYPIPKGHSRHRGNGYWVVQFNETLQTIVHTVLETVDTGRERKEEEEEWIESCLKFLGLKDDDANTIDKWYGVHFIEKKIVESANYKRCFPERYAYWQKEKEKAKGARHKRRKTQSEAPGGHTIVVNRDRTVSDSDTDEDVAERKVEHKLVAAISRVSTFNGPNQPARQPAAVQSHTQSNSWTPERMPQALLTHPHVVSQRETNSSSSGAGAGAAGRSVNVALASAAAAAVLVTGPDGLVPQPPVGARPLQQRSSAAFLDANNVEAFLHRYTMDDVELSATETSLTDGGGEDEEEQQEQEEPSASASASASASGSVSGSATGSDNEAETQNEPAVQDVEAKHDIGEDGEEETGTETRAGAGAGASSTSASAAAAVHESANVAVLAALEEAEAQVRSRPNSRLGRADPLPIVPPSMSGPTISPVGIGRTVLGSVDDGDGSNLNTAAKHSGGDAT